MRGRGGSCSEDTMCMQVGRMSGKRRRVVSAVIGRDAMVKDGFPKKCILPTLLCQDV